MGLAPDPAAAYLASGYGEVPPNGRRVPRGLGSLIPVNGVRHRSGSQWGTALGRPSAGRRNDHLRQNVTTRLEVVGLQRGLDLLEVLRR
jgi:hypothetical protein